MACAIKIIQDKFNSNLLAVKPPFENMIKRVGQ